MTKGLKEDFASIRPTIDEKRM